jgi:ATP-dependent RNA helicase SUPV3L1/SUV3
MAKKKNKYQIKLNNKIRNYFDGLAFEDGVTTLEDDKLIELAMLLELDLKDGSRDEIIKALRRVWSQEGLKTRELIVTYLTKPYKALTKIATKPLDKVEKIIDLLLEIPHTREEEEQILQAFIDTKAAKITPQKIQSKLSYIRHKKRVKKVQKALDIEFDSLDRFCFYESFKFECDDIDFTKLLLCMSDSIDMDNLLKLEDTQVEAKLQQIKTDIISDYQNKIDEFISTLKSKSHRYLNKEQIQNALKSMPPEVWIDHAPLECVVLVGIIKVINPNYHVNQSTDHLIVCKNK